MIGTDKKFPFTEGDATKIKWANQMIRLTYRHEESCQQLILFFYSSIDFVA